MEIDLRLSREVKEWGYYATRKSKVNKGNGLWNKLFFAVFFAVIAVVGLVIVLRITAVTLFFHIHAV